MRPRGCIFDPVRECLVDVEAELRVISFQNDGPFLGTRGPEMGALNTSGRLMIVTPKRDHIFEERTVSCDWIHVSCAVRRSRSSKPVFSCWTYLDMAHPKSPPPVH